MDPEKKSVAQSQMSTATASIRKNKLQIWYKLAAMTALPLLSLICLSGTLIAKQIGEAQAAGHTALIGDVTDKIHLVLKEIMAERGYSTLYIASGGILANSSMYAQRYKTDFATKKYSSRFKERLSELTEDEVLELGILEELLSRINTTRAYVDTMPESAEDTIADFTRIAEYGINYIRKRLLEPKDRQASVLLSAIVNWMYAEDYTGRLRGFFSSALARGTITNYDLQRLSRYTAIRNDYVEAAILQSDKTDGAAGAKSETVQYALKANSLIQKYLDAGPGDAELEEASEWYSVQDTYIKKKYDFVRSLLVKLDDKVKSRQRAANASRTIEIVLVIVCVAVAVGLAVVAAGGVAAPFVRLSRVKVQLSMEAAALEANNEAVSRFVPFEMLKILNVKDVSALQLGHSSSARVTCLFGDIVSFTTLSTQLSPDEVFKFLNSWLSGLIPIIQRTGGVVDKFLGDGIMAFFYKPVDCVAAGVQIWEWADEANRVREMTGGMPLAFGLGCNTGEVSLGTIGTAGRMDTTSSSESVDVAGRVEAATRNYKARFVVSGNTMHTLGATEFSFRCVGHLKTKKKASVALYECLNSCKDAAERAHKENSREWFEAAINAYEAGDLEESVSLFKKALLQYPEDECVKLYLEKLAKLTDTKE